MSCTTILYSSGRHIAEVLGLVALCDGEVYFGVTFSSHLLLAPILFLVKARDPVLEIPRRG